MKLLQRGVALALLTTFTLASETALAYEQDKTYKITVLHTNDHHGHFWRNEYGEYGLAAQKTLVDGIRKEVAAEGGSVLLLSGGDINTGVPESDLQDAEPDLRLRLKAVACCYFPVATLTLACPSLTYRMPNLIFAV